MFLPISKAGSCVRKLWLYVTKLLSVYAPLFIFISYACAERAIKAIGWNPSLKERSNRLSYRFTNYFATYSIFRVLKTKSPRRPLSRQKHFSLYYCSISKLNLVPRLRYYSVFPKMCEVGFAFFPFSIGRKYCLCYCQCDSTK